MSYFYPENEPKQPFQFNSNSYYNANAVGKWAEHYSNVKTLEFLAKGELNFRAKRELEREIGVGRKKMEYWQRHPNWSPSSASSAKAEVDKMWQTK